MKATIQLLVLLVVISLVFTQCTKVSPEEIVHIPDQNFRTALIEQGVDKNKDGIITFEEAEAILTVDLWGIGVSDLTGIEAYINLDISSNTNLSLAGFDNMPMLTEVCVWTLPFPPSGVSLLMGFSPNVVFTTGCSD